MPDTHVDWTLFFRRVAELQRNYPAYRVGQSMFNALAELYPLIAEELRATNADPYYRDDKVGEFLEWLEQYA